MGKEVRILLSTARKDEERIKNILNPKLTSKDNPEVLYKESIDEVSKSEDMVKEAEREDDELKNALLDDYELISTQLMNLGLIRLVLEEERNDLITLKKELPLIKKELKKIGSLIREREML